MIITTQDGRKLNINRNHRLSTWTSRDEKDLIIHVETEPVKVPCKPIRYFSGGAWHESTAEYFYWHSEIVLKDVVGRYKTKTSRDKADAMLNEAIKVGAPVFTVPQDAFAKTAEEQFEDFCEEHNLTLVSINELGYTPEDEVHNRRIWATTSDFEQRNILVADPTGNYDVAAFGGAYSTSFNKWLALQTKAKAAMA